MNVDVKYLLFIIKECVDNTFVR